MRKTMLLSVVVGSVLLLVRPASAAPTSTDPRTASQAAATWLAGQVNDQGFIPSSGNPANPNLSATAQAVLALASAGVGRNQVDAMLAYLGAHVDDYVVRQGNDDPGALGYLILGAEATGQDPTAFGTGSVDLVSRLEATQQPSGLFGANDPSFDGAFRQGLALMALHAAGQSNSAGVTWLVDQQCDDGLWTSFRADTSVPCPAVDPSTFTGADTNSTAMAILGLKSQGDTSDAGTGATALDGVRNSGGGWGFLAASDQSTDANSTGVVVLALRAVQGSLDAQGATALLDLQVGCGGDPADQGGIAFQDDGSGTLVPDVLATVQATPALADVAWPLDAPTIATSLPAVCAAAVTTTTSTTTTTVVAAAAEDGPGMPVTTSAGELPRTGSSSIGLAGLALVLIGVGVCVVTFAEDRRART